MKARKRPYYIIWGDYVLVPMTRWKRFCDWWKWWYLRRFNANMKGKGW